MNHKHKKQYFTKRVIIILITLSKGVHLDLPRYFPFVYFKLAVIWMIEFRRFGTTAIDLRGTETVFDKP